MSSFERECHQPNWSEQELRDIQLQLQAMDDIESMEEMFAANKEKERYAKN